MHLRPCAGTIRSLLTLACSSCLALGAQAALIRADFSGTITDSYDNRLDSTQPVGMLFGGPISLGQKTISGSIYFDDTLYSDSNAATNVGFYGGTGNGVRTVFTIDGKTFDSDWFQTTGAPYHAESTALYDNASGHDFFNVTKAVAYKPIDNQGAFGQLLFTLDLVDYLSPAGSFTNFLTGTTLDQAIQLNSVDISKLETRSGSYTLQLYCGWQNDFGFAASGFCPEGVYTYPNGNVVDYRLAPTGTNANRTAQALGDLRAVYTNAAGEFTLNSFSLQRVPATPAPELTVPEPGSLPLVLGSLLGLTALSRRKPRAA